MRSIHSNMSSTTQKTLLLKYIDALVRSHQELLLLYSRIYSYYLSKDFHLSLKINWINIWIRTSCVWLASRASCFLELSADFRHRCRATLQTTNLPCIYYANMNESNSLNHSNSFLLDLMQYHISWISTSYLLDDASFCYTTNNCTTLLLHRYYHFMQHTSHEVISTSMHQEIPCDMIYDIIRHISTAYLPRAKLISYIHSTRRSDTRDLILSHLHFFFRTFNR